MNNDRLWLREIAIDDDFEGLNFLQDIVNEEGIMVAPAPKDIDEHCHYWIRK